MPIKAILIQKVKDSLELTHDLYNKLEEKNLSLKIPELPSNSIGEQSWCIIGARESYLKAIRAGKWDGFSCSLTDTNNSDLVLSKLENSQNEIIEYISENELEDSQLEFVFILFRHETQHHGQLIRYFYANKLEFPNSWNKTYTV